MKRLALLAIALSGSVANATNVNLSVKVDGGPHDGMNAITVAPSATVNFRIEASLTDNLNEGLGLIGFDVDHTGGALASNTIQIPTGAITCQNPMPAFVKPVDNGLVAQGGITNPAGFGGTPINGDLIQCGGGQNTINNTADNADFPLGAIRTGVAQPAGCGAPAVIARGSLTASANDGVYFLNVLNLFANVIKDNETGAIYWATEAAGVGTIMNLQITVTAGDVPAEFVSANPTCDVALSRASKKVIRLTFDDGVTMPTAGEISIRALANGGAFTGPELSGNFTYSLESGNTVLRLEETGTAMANVTWYGITNPGWGDAEPFKVTYVAMPGNVNNDGFTDFGDLSEINVNLTNTPADNNKYNVNADNFVDFGDMSAAFSFNGAAKPTKPTGHACP